MVRRAAAGVLDHLRVQGESAACAQRIHDVGLVRRGFSVADHSRTQPNDDRGRHQRVEPVHVPDDDEEPAVPHAVQHGQPGDQRAGRRVGLHPAWRDTGRCRARDRGDGEAAGGRRLRLLRGEYAAGGHRHRAVHPSIDLQGVEREFSLERAELFRGRSRRRGIVPSSSATPPRTTGWRCSPVPRSF